jgi:predicted RNA methylase
MNALVPRADIHQIVAHRGRTIELYAQAFDLVAEAGRAAQAAAPSAHYTLPELALRSNNWPTRGRDEFLGAVTKTVDRGIWKHLIFSTGMESLMDAQARDEFQTQVEKDPPPATVENCLATMETLVGDADLIFKRGIANAFSRLDRRFRSHDGFKIGARVVISYALQSFGGWSRGQDAIVRDVERTFCVLDGKPQPDYSAGIVGAIDTARRAQGWGAAAFEAETDYFRAKGFKNGNIHLWFKRDDLLSRVNQLLAAHYGAALGAAPDVAEKRHAPGTAMAKNFGFFETPAAVGERVIEGANLYRRRDDPVLTVLEPSAGAGALARLAKAAGARVTAIEIQAHLVEGLAGQVDELVHGNFLDQRPEILGKFDRVVMNPPFDRRLDVDHVRHAIDFLKPGGRLAAVMSAGVEFHEDRKTSDFRALVERLDGRFQDLPAGSFAEAGTNVNTCLLTLRMPAAA